MKDQVITQNTSVLQQSIVFQKYKHSYNSIIYLHLV